MQMYTLELADGRRLSSGTPGQDALCRVKLTRSVNDATELTFGACCAAMLEAEIFYYNQIPIAPGDRLTLYRQQDPLGIFYAEQVSQAGANRLQLTAYDSISRLDQDLTAWLASLQDWPIAAGRLAQRVAQRCGLELPEEEVPNGDYPVQAFTAQVTGRRLMQWLGQIFGRFLVADAQGKLRWSWYTPNRDMTAGPTAKVLYHPLEAAYDRGELTLRGIQGALAHRQLTLLGAVAQVQGRELALYAGTSRQCHYLMNGLSAASYETAPVGQVRIQPNGAQEVFWPEKGENAYVLSGNPMITGESALALAQTLYGILEAFSYVPCTVSLPLGAGICAGQLLQVVDAAGREFVTLVMLSREEDGAVYAESTGSANRQSTTAANSHTYSGLSGKVLQLDMDMDGLRLEHSLNAQALSSLELSLEGVRSQVQTQQANAEKLTAMEQDAQALRLRIETVESQGVSRLCTQTGYTFDSDGLRIRKSGQVMENRLDNTGMYVLRDGQVILQASDTGVSAVDVQVKNYLLLGAHSRLEDYATADDPNRTACFYV